MVERKERAFVGSRAAGVTSFAWLWQLLFDHFLALLRETLSTHGLVPSAVVCLPVSLSAKG